MPSACMSKIAKDSSKGFFFNQTKSKLAQDEVVFALEDPAETTHKSCSLSASHGQISYGGEKGHVMRDYHPDGL